MGSHRVRLATCIAAVCTVVPGLAAEPAASELEETVQRLNALDSWIDDAGKRLAGQQKQLASADRRIAEMAERGRALSNRMAAAETNLADLGRQRERLEEQYRGQSERIAEHLRAAWRLSGRATIKAVLNQEDPAAYQRLIRYHGYFARARADAIAEFRATVASLRENEQSLRRQRGALQAAQRSLGVSRATLLEERAERRELIAALHTDLSDRNREREQLEKNRLRLTALVADLQRQAERAAKRTPERTGSGLGAGELPWPVDGEVHRRFGQQRASGRMRWQGMVIRAPLGSDVRAVAAGHVVFADWLRGFGLIAIVDHGDDHMSLYGYADALYKRIGDRVEGGETIAAVGQSGGQADVGLYFEIRHGGKPIDPRQWLQAHAAH